MGIFKSQKKATIQLKFGKMSTYLNEFEFINELNKDGSVGGELDYSKVLELNNQLKYDLRTSKVTWQEESYLEYDLEDFILIVDKIAKRVKLEEEDVYYSTLLLPRISFFVSNGTINLQKKDIPMLIEKYEEVMNSMISSKNMVEMETSLLNSENDRFQIAKNKNRIERLEFRINILREEINANRQKLEEYNVEQQTTEKEETTEMVVEPEQENVEEETTNIVEEVVSESDNSPNTEDLSKFETETQLTPPNNENNEEENNEEEISVTNNDTTESHSTNEYTSESTEGVKEEETISTETNEEKAFEQEVQNEDTSIVEDEIETKELEEEIVEAPTIDADSEDEEDVITETITPSIEVEEEPDEETHEDTEKNIPNTSSKYSFSSFIGLLNSKKKKVVLEKDTDSNVLILGGNFVNNKSVPITEIEPIKYANGIVIFKNKQKYYLGYEVDVKKKVYQNNDNDLIELNDCNETLYELMAGKDIEIEHIDNQLLSDYYKFINSLFANNLNNSKCKLSLNGLVDFKSSFNKLIAEKQIKNKIKKDIQCKAYRCCNDIAEMLFIYGHEEMNENELIHTLVSDVIDNNAIETVEKLKSLKELDIIDDSCKKDIEALVEKVLHINEVEPIQESYEKATANKEKEPKVSENNVVETDAKKLQQTTSYTVEPTPIKDVEVPVRDIRIKNVEFSRYDTSEYYVPDVSNIKYAIKKGTSHGAIEISRFSIDNQQYAVEQYVYLETYMKEIGIMYKDEPIFLVKYNNETGVSELKMSQSEKHRRHYDKGQIGELISLYEIKLLSMVNNFEKSLQNEMEH